MNIEEWKQKILEEYRLQGCATKGISYSEFETTCIADIN